METGKDEQPSASAESYILLRTLKELDEMSPRANAREYFIAALTLAAKADPLIDPAVQQHIARAAPKIVNALFTLVDNLADPEPYKNISVSTQPLGLLMDVKDYSGRNTHRLFPLLPFFTTTTPIPKWHFQAQCAFFFNTVVMTAAGQSMSKTAEIPQYLHFLEVGQPNGSSTMLKRGTVDVEYGVPSENLIAFLGDVLTAVRTTSVHNF